MLSSPCLTIVIPLLVLECLLWHWVPHSSTGFAFLHHAGRNINKTQLESAELDGSAGLSSKPTAMVQKSASVCMQIEEAYCYGSGIVVTATAGYTGLQSLKVQHDCFRDTRQTDMHSDASIRPKKCFCLVPVSDRPCQFMCNPNYFMSLGKKKPIFFFNPQIQHTTHWEYPCCCTKKTIARCHWKNKIKYIPIKIQINLPMTLGLF